MHISYYFLYFLFCLWDILCVFSHLFTLTICVIIENALFAVFCVFLLNSVAVYLFSIQCNWTAAQIQSNYFTRILSGCCQIPLYIKMDCLPNFDVEHAHDVDTRWGSLPPRSHPLTDRRGTTKSGWARRLTWPRNPAVVSSLKTLARKLPVHKIQYLQNKIQK